MIVLQGLFQDFFGARGIKVVGTCEQWEPWVVGYARRAGHAFTNKSSGNGGGEVPVKQVCQVGSN